MRSRYVDNKHKLVDYIQDTSSLVKIIQHTQTHVHT